MVLKGVSSSFSENKCKVLCKTPAKGVHHGVNIRTQARFSFLGCQPSFYNQVYPSNLWVGYLAPRCLGMIWSICSTNVNLPNRQETLCLTPDLCLVRCKSILGGCQIGHPSYCRNRGRRTSVS